MCFSKEDSLKCKGFAILIMLFHHMYKDSERYQGFAINFAPLPEGLVNQIADFLKICVGIYVFVSAYGLTISYQNWKYGKSSFFLHRIFKMMFSFYIIYLICILASFLVAKDWNIFAAYGGQGRLAGLWYMFIDFLGLADLFGTPTFNLTWWYMSFAIMLVFLIPVLNWIYDKMNVVWMLAMAVLLPRALGLSADNNVIRYLLILTIGIVCARTQLMAKAKEYLSKQKKVTEVFWFVALLLLHVVFFRLREGILKGPFIAVWDGIIPFMTICLLTFFINRVAILSAILKFFGKYSTIMFLTHTLIRYYWYEDFIYGHTSAWLDYGILLAASLMVAMAIDFFMKVTRLQRVENVICRRLVLFADRRIEGTHKN